MRRILKADVVVTMDSGGKIFRPGSVLLTDDRITGVGLQAEMEEQSIDEVIDLKGRLLMPGLVNAHTHTPMVLLRGQAEGRSLLTWEGWYYTIRVWEDVLDPDMIPPAVAVSCAEMIRTGTTCFADQYFYMDRILPVVRRSGFRAALAYGIVEMGDAAARRRELAAAASFLDSASGEERIQGWVGPHAFFVDNSLEAISLEMELADRYRTGIHFHLSTSGEEDQFCHDHFGRSAVEQMEAMGLLERRLIAAHCISVPQEDFTRLAGRPFTAVIAASACMRAGAEIAPLKAMRAAGINTAIGTDNVTNNNTYDLFNEMQTVAKLTSLREHEPGVVGAREILDMATMGGARALGLDDTIGSLEAGKKADIISLDYEGIGWPPDAGQDVYTALVYSVSGMHVQDVMVDGNWLLRNGDLMTLDYSSARADLNEAFAELQLRNLRKREST